MTNPRIAYQMSSTRKRLSPPGGKPLIVHLVVNVEHWRFEHAMPRKIITAPHGAEQVPDIPMNRLGEPEEIARLVAFLASEAAANMTGTSLTADGGWTKAIA